LGYIFAGLGFNPQLRGDQLVPSFNEDLTCKDSIESCSINDGGLLTCSCTDSSLAGSMTMMQTTPSNDVCFSADCFYPYQHEPLEILCCPLWVFVTHTLKNKQVQQLGALCSHCRGIMCQSNGKITKRDKFALIFSSSQKGSTLKAQMTPKARTVLLVLYVESRCTLSFPRSLTISKWLCYSYSDTNVICI
jgi:hypothetical protein